MPLIYRLFADMKVKQTVEANKIMGTILQLSPIPESTSLFSYSLFARRQTFSKFDKCQRQARHAYSQKNIPISTTAVETAEVPAASGLARMPKPLPPLAILPFPNLIRSYLTTAVSSSPLLLRTSLRALNIFAHSRSVLLNPDRNPILHFLLKRTVYAQFCAGERADEVNQTITRLKQMGYRGVILGYAREICPSEKKGRDLRDRVKEEIVNANEISVWAKGTLDTVNMAQAGDFVALKFTGLGTQALEQLMEDRAPSSLIDKAITDVCELAEARGVRLLFDAEQHVVQAGIDTWTTGYMKRYNRKGTALVYGTYQAYKKSTPCTLAKHLELAHRENFILGVKLVRGAYLGSDPRDLFWDTIDDTHSTYDGIAESLMRRTYNETLKPISTDVNAFPSIHLILAGHNSDSVMKAQKIRNSQVASGVPLVDLAYGQLMGMAENISCGLVQTGKLARQQDQEDLVDIPRVYQYLVWGSVGECSQYLVRRAEENMVAVTRIKEGRKALGKELFRRLGMSSDVGWKEMR